MNMLEPKTYKEFNNYERKPRKLNERKRMAVKRFLTSLNVIQRPRELHSLRPGDSYRLPHCIESWQINYKFLFDLDIVEYSKDHLYWPREAILEARDASGY